MPKKPILLRITTAPISLKYLLGGQLAFMQKNGFEVHSASSDGPEVDEVVASEGVIHHKVKLTRVVSPFTDLIALFHLIWLMLRLRPAIVHTHTPKAGLLGMMAAFLTFVPVRLHTVAGMPLMEVRGIMRIILEFCEHITYICANRVYPNSIGLKKWIEAKLYSNDKKLYVIGKGSTNGIDTDYFSPDAIPPGSRENIRKELGIPNGHLVFIFIGRLVADKGVAETYKAFKIFNNVHPDTTLLVVGPFEDDRNPVPEDVKKGLMEHPRIVLTGFIRDVRPYLAASDIFLFPSYREGFPNVPMQAGAMGLPVIASDINGCNEIIEEGENGLLVKPRNSGELLEAMKLLAENEPIRKGMGERARRIIVEKFSQDRIWNQILMEYKLLMEAKGIG